MTARVSLRSSKAFGIFAIVFAIAVPIIYVVSEIGSLPLFTYHPGVNRVDFGWVAARPPRFLQAPAAFPPRRD